MSGRSLGGWFLQGIRAAARRAPLPNAGVSSLHRRLRLEPLEDRRMLSVVNTLVDEDDGVGVGGISLRDAIAAAVPGETITFAASLTSGGPATILLTHGALPTITNDLTISGPGANLLTIDANDPTPAKNADGSRIFFISDSTVTRRVVSISGLRLTGADAPLSGGAIRCMENLTVTNCIITGNASNSQGGGIFVYTGQLTLIGSTITNNSAVNSGGGICTDTAQTTITNCAISGNSAGGALFSFNTVTITGSTISNNLGGRGLWNSFGGVTITNCLVEGNMAPGLNGGGILNAGNMTIVDSTIRGNTANQGGGIDNLGGSLIIKGSTINGNTASVGNGGGINNAANVLGLRISESTISGNTAQSRGGGLYNQQGLALFERSTVTLNDAPAGAGSGVASKGAAGVTTDVTGTIIAGNLHSDVDIVGGATNSVLSHDFNLIGTGSAVGAFNLANDQTGIANPQLGPLADNGGKTRTHALLAGSLAIDKGNPAVVPGLPANDQRGAPFARVVGTQIDIGALERQAIPPAVFGDYNHDGTVNAADYTVWRNTMNSNPGAYNGADGSGNSVVDFADYLVWKSHYGQTVPAAGSGGESVAENTFQGSGSVGTTEQASIGTPAAIALAEPVAVVPIGFGEVHAEVSVNADSGRGPFSPSQGRSTVAAAHDDALLAWCAERQVASRSRESSANELTDVSGTGDDSSDAADETFDVALEGLPGVPGESI